MKGPVIIPLTR